MRETPFFYFELLILNIEFELFLQSFNINEIDFEIEFISKSIFSIKFNSIDFRNDFTNML